MRGEDGLGSGYGADAVDGEEFLAKCVELCCRGTEGQFALQDTVRSTEVVGKQFNAIGVFRKG